MKTDQLSTVAVSSGIEYIEWTSFSKHAKGLIEPYFEFNHALCVTYLVLVFISYTCVHLDMHKKLPTFLNGCISYIPFDFMKIYPLCTSVTYFHWVATKWQHW